MTWHLYILLCEHDKLYTGITTDVAKRYQTHLQNKGAKFTQKNKPLKIVYQEICDSLSHARQRENEIKKMTRPQKDRLIANASF